MTDEPGTAVRVRRADERDVAVLADLRRTWSEQRGRLAPGTDPRFEQAFASWWHAERSRRAFWIAEVDDGQGGRTAVGSINVVEIGGMPAPAHRPERWGYVGNVVVLEGSAGRGVPRRLLAAVLAHAREHGFTRLALRPAATATDFYRTLGFRPAGDGMVVLETADDGRNGD